MCFGFKSLPSAAAVLLSLVLSGCATNANITDGKLPQSDQGLVALQINSGDIYVLDFVPYVQTPTLKDKMANPALKLVVKRGLGYYVVPMKAGVYRMGYINGPGYADLSHWSGFSVKAGEITYIGFLNLDVQGHHDAWTMHTNVYNFGRSMKEYLANNYPFDFKTMPYNHQLMHR